MARLHCDLVSVGQSKECLTLLHCSSSKEREGVRTQTRFLQVVALRKWNRVPRVGSVGSGIRAGSGVLGAAPPLHKGAAPRPDPSVNSG